MKLKYIKQLKHKKDIQLCVGACKCIWLYVCVRERWKKCPIKVHHIPEEFTSEVFLYRTGEDEEES